MTVSDTRPADALRERAWENINGVVAAAPRRALLGRAALALGTVAAAAMLTIFLSSVPGTPVRPTAAFAQVEEALGRVRTVTWRETHLERAVFYADGRVEVTKRPAIRTLWADLERPRLAQRRLVQRRDGQSHELRHVTLPTAAYQIEHETVLYYSYYPWGIRTPPVFGPDAGRTPRERLRAIVLFTPPSGTDQSPNRWDSSDGRGIEVERVHAWKSREATLDGVRVLRFDTAVRFRSPEDKAHHPSGIPWKDTLHSWTFWVDPSTYRMIRREERTRYEGPGKPVELTTVSDNFRYDVTPPPGIFDYEPPVGIPYSFVPLPERPATAEEQTQINATLTRAIEAWNSRDRTGYAAAWDFTYGTRNASEASRRRTEELSRMAAMSPSHRLGPIGPLRATSRISAFFIRRSASDPFPPREPGEFRMTVQVQTEGTSGMPSIWNVNLRHGPDGFRIVRAQLWELKPGPPSGTATRPAGRR